ncbi:MAG: AAA family ATPase [Muribaculaceae bacterium]|nr:AAA family ATPase [Muribaculaceae bacterium]
MKFQKLTIHNIASIEDAVIDFEAQPLANSEVFLITGKTGSGKSTILDAICLALFANTPRLEGTNMQGNTSDNDNITIKDPRQLMRRNTGEAFVELTFVGNNDVPYKATWSIHRGHNKAGNKIQSKDWALENLSTGNILSKDKEIQGEIAQAIGLDFSQFSRTTMLAQGEFTRFLNSKDDDKASILEKITGVDIYSKIGAKTFTATGEKKREWENAKQLIEGIKLLSDEEITARNESLKEIDTDLEKTQKAYNDNIVKREWINKNKDLAQQIANAETSLKQATEATNSDEFKRKEQLVADWNATIEARKWLTDKKDSQKAQAENEKKLSSLTQEFENLLNGILQEEQELSEIQQKIVSINTFLTAASHKAIAYENIQKITSLLIAICNGRTMIEENNRVLSIENNNLNTTLIPTLTEAQNQLKLIADALKEKEETIAVQEKSLESLNIPLARATRDNEREKVSNINTAKLHLNNLDKVIADIESRRQKLASQLNNLNKMRGEADSLATPLQKALEDRDLKKAEYDKQRDTIEKFAIDLRAKLHMGDTCPICRQKIEIEIPIEEDLAALISGIKKAADDAELHYKQLEGKKNKIDAEIKAESAIYDDELKSLNNDTTVANATRQAQEACTAFGIDITDTTSAVSALESLEKLATENIAKLDAEISNGEKLEEAIKTLRNEGNIIRAEHDAMTQKLQKAEKSVNDCKGRIETAKALINAKQNEVDKTATQAKELITFSNEWESNPTTFADQLNVEANEYSKRSAEKQELENKLQNADSNLKNLKNVISTIIDKMPQWSNIKPTNGKKVANILTCASSINSDAATTISHLKEVNEKISQCNQQLDSFFTATNIDSQRLNILCNYNANDIEGINNKLNESRAQVVAKKSLFEYKTKELQKHQLCKPQIDDCDTIESLNNQIEILSNQISSLSEKKGGINQELNANEDNKKRIGALKDDADKKMKEYLKWERLNNLIGCSDGKKFRKIAQSYVLNSLIISANSYMKTLTDRYTLKVEPGTFVISLEDAYQGYVSRSASTISGGESFLVSLSLALALSDIGQSLSANILFIDEGFGSLSGEPLRNAINTLRTLHSRSGRHVGIISHVEELKERIPVQIQVIQEGQSSSSQIKVVS